METDKDHTHFLIKSKPKVSVLESLEDWNKSQLIECGKLKPIIWRSIIG